MFSLHLTGLFLILIIPTFAQNAGSGQPIQFVDPLIGTINGGHVFPGATLPFGMAKAVADVNGEAQGGYASDDSDSEKKIALRSTKDVG